MTKKILIVEDNSDSRDILRFVLKATGYEVIEAATGLEGIQKAQDEMPDLIIMDLGLPGMDGIQTTRSLKQEPRTAAIPVVAYTIWGEDFREKAIEAGVVEFLCKTTAPHVLREVILRYLQTN